ncbi:hypothetical protein BJV74DRAFT_421172 [Russula compacta]|nr:hypothetical protein BJV74DRAFT_421172 [Russula compacta]
MMSPNLIIDNLPDEVLLDIFDSYRQHFTHDQSLWNTKHKWFKLMHVCRRWRCIVFASSTRLDLCLFVSNSNPGNMNTIFSPHLSPLPIAINHDCPPLGVTSHMKGKEIGCMLAVLKRCGDRVRGITFSGSAPDFDKLFEATKHPFPILEDLELYHCSIIELNLPATFLMGSAPHLRRLKLDRISLISISSLLSSAMMLIELCLGIYNPSPKALLLTHLQNMHCLRHLKLRTWEAPSLLNSPVPPTNPRDTFLLPKLTSFHYQGPSLFLSAFMARFTAPSLQDVHFIFDGDDDDEDEVPILHLPRFLDGVEKLYPSVQIISECDYFRMSLLTRSESVDHPTPSFRFCSPCSPESIMRMSAALSAKLATVDELLMVSIGDSHEIWDDDVLLPSFLRHFRSVKVLRVEDEAVFAIARALRPDGESVFPDLLPMLEEIEIRVRWSGGFPESPFPSQPSAFSERGMIVAAFRPFLTARQEAGRPIKIYGSCAHRSLNESSRAVLLISKGGACSPVIWFVNQNNGS